MTEVPVTIWITGATASGKTEVGLELAQLLPCQLISVDSALVYRGLDIGTAKPDRETLRQRPHALIDIVEADDPYSAGRFVVDARREIRAARERGLLPVLVGGTMLYFSSLEGRLDDLPPAQESVRAAIDRRAQASGWAALHEELRQKDAAAAERIHPNDRQRIQRALEIIELTGKAPGSWRHKPVRVGGDQTFRFALPPRHHAALKERIAQRFAAMMELGFVDELRGLRERLQLSLDLPSMRAVGYRQLWSYLEGECDLATAERQAIQATLQLAKRQLSWLRGRGDLEWLEGADPRQSKRTAAAIKQQLEAALDAAPRIRGSP